MKSAEERKNERDALLKLSEQANELSEKRNAEMIEDTDVEEEEETTERRPTVFMDEPEEEQEDEKKDELPSWETKPDTEKAVFNGLGWLKSICIGVLIGVFLVVFVIQRNNVYGSSMNPTLHEGDVIFAEKISTYFDNFDRGDVVILDGSNMEGYDHDEYLIKRVIGLPGETIKIENGKVFIKKKDSELFAELQEDYLAAGTLTTVSGSGWTNGYNEITLGDDEYYCMGDNRMVSNDSRNLGPFSADRIKGIALIRVYPFSSIGKVS